MSFLMKMTIMQLGTLQHLHALISAKNCRVEANMRHFGGVGWQPTALTGTNVGYKGQRWGQHIAAIATWGHSLAGSGHWGAAINCQPRTQPANHPGVGFSFTWVEVTCQVACQGKFSWCWVTCTLQKHEETHGFRNGFVWLGPCFCFRKMKHQVLTISMATSCALVAASKLIGS